VRSDEIRAGQIRLKSLREKSSGLQALRGQLQRDLSSRLKEVDGLSEKLDRLTKVGELFRALMDLLVLDHVQSIENVITEGLQTIFVDQDLTFEAEVSQRYNKLAIDFFIREDNQRVSVRAHPLEAFGGGPASIASLILKVLALRRLKKWPLLVMDETLAAVSVDYVDQTGLFLRGLARKTGITILLVTHNRAFLDHAVIGYTGSAETDADGVRYLQLRREAGHAL
jgi:ABC-type dipeptide/oligopeptide/nickel transport system ATPase component